MKWRVKRWNRYIHEGSYRWLMKPVDRESYFRIGFHTNPEAMYPQYVEQSRLRPMMEACDGYTVNARHGALFTLAMLQLEPEQRRT